MSTSNLPRFNDTAQAFQHLSDAELRRAVALFSLIGKPWLVNVGSALANLALALRIPLGWAVRPTVYAHFCGGESIDDSEETMAKLAAHNVRTILDYSAEGQTGEAALDAARELERIGVFGRRTDAARELVAELQGQVRASLEVVSELRPALGEADVVATATPSEEPLFSLEDLAPGTHLSCVGSFTPAMRELDVETVAAASVFVDQRAAAEVEAGELIAARDAGRSRPENWIEVGEVELGRHPGRRGPGELTLFKSVGLAAQDVVVAAAALASPRLAGTKVCFTGE